MGYEDRQRSGRPSDRRFEAERNRRGPERTETEPPKREVKTVRQVKTKFGTRVAHRITCPRCGVIDRVAFVPRDPEQTLCRKCAAEELDIDDPNSGIRVERDMTCSQCGRVEKTIFFDKDPYICRDCLKGIWSMQGDKNKRAEVAGRRSVLKVRRGS